MMGDSSRGGTLYPQWERKMRVAIRDLCKDN